MIRGLFARLTGLDSRGAELFALAVEQARRPHWFQEGPVPDSVDGRFAVLATVTALIVVRLEADGDRGSAASVALTERFIEAMDAEHRQMGVSDPAIGKQVRRLVASLAGRVGRWRDTVAGTGDWTEATKQSIDPRGELPAGGIAHCADALRSFWGQLERTGLEALKQGRLE